MCDCKQNQEPQTDLADRQVELPPPPPRNEADIVRYHELAVDNGYTPQSIEPSPELRAQLEERDRHLAALELNEQGDLDRFQLRKDEQDNGSNA